MSRHLILFLLNLIFLSACHRTFRPQQLLFQDYKITGAVVQDSAMHALLQPYADSVNRSMGAVLGIAAVTLEKKKPEGTLGNLMADILRQKAAEHFDTVIDAAFLNYGAIRLPMLPAGNVSLGKIYELSPFDNTIVVMRLTGAQLKAFADIQAAAGGWPCSGVQYIIRNKRATEFSIGGLAVEDAALYSIATLDYLANGGDNCALLRSLPRKDRGVLFREAIINYVSERQRQGKTLAAQIENRVVNAE